MYKKTVLTVFDIEHCFIFIFNHFTQSKTIKKLKRKMMYWGFPYILIAIRTFRISRNYSEECGTITVQNFNSFFSNLPLSNNHIVFFLLAFAGLLYLLIYPFFLHNKVTTAINIIVINVVNCY